MSVKERQCVTTMLTATIFLVGITAGATEDLKEMELYALVSKFHQ